METLSPCRILMFAKMSHHGIKYVHIYHVFVISSLFIHDNMLSLLQQKSQNITSHKSMQVKDDRKGAMRNKGVQSTPRGLQLPPAMMKCLQRHQRKLFNKWALLEYENLAASHWHKKAGHSKRKGCFHLIWLNHAVYSVY